MLFRGVMSEAATSSSRRARPDHHRLPLVSWRPPFELRELLDAWAKERGGSRQGRSRAEAVTRLVSQALQAGDEALTEGAANEVLEEIGEVQADLRGLGIQLAELRAQLDRLGPATLAVKHVVAYWMSLDPANRTLGETPEMLEERLLFEMDQIGSDNWRLLHEDDPAAPDAGVGEPPAAPFQSAIERHILYWEGRARPSQSGELQLSPNKDRRIRSWAWRSGCKPRVALEALLDFALSAAGEPGVPESQVEEIKVAIGQVGGTAAGLRAQLEKLTSDVAFVGELVGVAPLLSLLCTQDQGIRHPALQGQEFRLGSEELYARLAAYIWGNAVAQWDGGVQSLLDRAVPEGPPVEEEWLQGEPCAREGEAGEGGS